MENKSIVKIVGIKTNNGYYITDELTQKTYNTSYLSGKLVNGETPVPTFHSKWFKVVSEPVKLQQYQPMPNINKRYELIDPDLASKFKLVYKEEDVNLGWDDEKDEYTWSDEFKSIRPLYTLKSDPQDPILVDLEFEFELITEIDEIISPAPFSYKRLGNYNKPTSPVTGNDTQVDLISSIITPSILLHTAPCKLSSKESYDIVRAFIKDNIDPKQAEITSDFDFCFNVKKRIHLANEYDYKVDVSGHWRNKRIKPKYETRVQKKRDIPLFSMTYSPSNYQGYIPIKGFEGDSRDDLKSNIDAYLNHLISVINTPVHECKHCDGTGCEPIKTN